MLTKLATFTLVSLASYAAPIFTASTGTSCESLSVTGGIQIGVRSIITSCAGSFLVDGRASAGPGGVGVEAHLFQVGEGTARGASGVASSLTDFMISGPAGPVTVSLNLALTANLPIPTAGGGQQVKISVEANGALFTGVFNQQNQNGIVTTSSAGVLAPPAGTCLNPCNLITADFVVPANQWVPLLMTLSGSVGGFGGGADASVYAIDTLYFPLNGPVFNLPNGYNATIPDMNVVDNKVLSNTGQVPEPGTYLLTAAGLCVVAKLRRARLI